MESVKGHIEQIVYYNNENSWGIAKLLLDNGESLTVKGVFSAIEGDFVECHGNYVEDKKYGKQLNITDIIKVQPESKKDVIKYLSSGTFTGIGIKTAEVIYEKFGDKVFDVMDNEIEKFQDISGLTETKVKSIKNEWKEQKASKDTIIFLRQFNLSYSMINKLIDIYGKDTIKVIQEDPYVLVDKIEGIGFKTADRIGLKLGLSMDSIDRILAGIFYTLKIVLGEGHCYVNKKELLILVQHQLELHDAIDTISDCLSVLIDKELLVEKDLKIYLKGTYLAEQSIVKRISYKLKENNFNIKSVEQMIETECETGDMSLSEEQKKAVSEIIESPISILTGGAGVGKTTTVKLLLKLLENLGKEILLTTPTGRAAQRMKEVSSYGVKTIHRLLEWNPQEKGFLKNEVNQLKGDFLIVDETSMVDIFLMSSLIKSVPSGMQILFIGDTEQLPSVGAGSVLKDLIDSRTILTKELTQIFRQAESSDIVKVSHKIRRGEIPELKKMIDLKESEYKTIDCIMVDSMDIDSDEIHFLNKFKPIINQKDKGHKKNILKDGWRDFLPKKVELLSQDEVAKINSIVKDYPMNHPQVKLGFHLEEYLEKLITNMIPFFVGSDLEIQILCPMKKGIMGTKNINKVVQEKINPSDNIKNEIKYGDTYFRENDRVIQTKNDYERGVFNGDIGRISKIVDNKPIIEFNTDIDKKVVYEKKDLDNLELAYAITIHKSQGSEFDVVILPLFNSHHIMLYRQLIYTGITRGKSYVAVFGEESALNKAVKNKDNTLRNTTLKEELIKSVIVDT
jgi:exodeoxyribonuclease V alpha subunit